MITLSEHFKARVVETQGGIPYGSNSYELVTTYRPSALEIYRAQKDLGYPPDGYGAPFAVDRRQLKSGKWVTRWQSASSCE